jgi:hypothetical protein
MDSQRSINSTNGRFLTSNTKPEEKRPYIPSHEPGRVPSQVPSADLNQKLYKRPDSFISFKRAA